MERNNISNFQPEQRAPICKQHLQINRTHTQEGKHVGRGYEWRRTSKRTRRHMEKCTLKLSDGKNKKIKLSDGHGPSVLPAAGGGEAAAPGTVGTVFSFQTHVRLDPALTSRNLPCRHCSHAGTGSPRTSSLAEALLATAVAAIPWCPPLADAWPHHAPPDPDAGRRVSRGWFGLVSENLHLRNNVCSTFSCAKQRTSGSPHPLPVGVRL